MERIKYWKGEYSHQVKELIENKIKLANDSKLPQFKGARIIFSYGDSGFEAALRTDEFNIFYTKNNHATIQLEDLQTNGRKFTAFMGLADKEWLDTTIEINSKDQMSLHFPSRGEYVVIVTSDAPNTSLNIPFYSMLITYEP